MGVHAGDNPFRVERMHGIPYWDPALDWEQLLTRLEALGWRASLVGKHGQGKTTLLLELGERLKAQGHATEHIVVGDENRVQSTLEPRGDTIYLIDGVERLEPMAWLAFRWRLREAKGAVITAHHPGRMPTLHLCRSTPATIAYLLRELVPEEAETLSERIPRFFDEYRGDCRKVLFALYDEYAGRGPEGESQA